MSHKFNAFTAVFFHRGASVVNLPYILFNIILIVKYRVRTLILISVHKITFLHLFLLC